jgi:hypothetical protein
MKLTVKQLVQASEALKRLGEKGIKALTQKVFYNISKNIRVISSELELYEKIRQSLIEKYSAEQKDGSFGVLPKDVPLLNAEIEDAQAREVELPILACTLTDEIIEKAEIHAADLAVLDWMLTLPEGE